MKEKFTLKDKAVIETEGQVVFTDFCHLANERDFAYFLSELYSGQNLFHLCEKTIPVFEEMYAKTKAPDVKKQLNEMRNTKKRLDNGKIDYSIPFAQPYFLTGKNMAAFRTLEDGNYGIYQRPNGLLVFLNGVTIPSKRTSNIGQCVVDSGIIIVADRRVKISKGTSSDLYCTAEVPAGRYNCGYSKRNNSFALKRAD